MKKLPSVKKDLGYFLRVWRVEHGITQEQAAKWFGINPSHWSLIESGDRTPSPKLAQRIAEETGLALSVVLRLKAS